MNSHDRKQIIQELQQALQAIPAAEFKPWRNRTTALFGHCAKKRASGLKSLSTQLCKGLYGTGRDVISHARNKEFLTYLKSNVQSSKDKLSNVSHETKALISLLREDPKQGAVHLTLVILGCYAGSGGIDGDGGFPDLDIAVGGIGFHRSPLFHSMIAGIILEATTLSLLDLVETTYLYLPKRHHAFWDKAILKADITIALATTSFSAGLAYHFLIDGTIDSGKAYTNLPISLPAEMHQAIMLANAVGEAGSVAESLKAINTGKTLHAVTIQIEKTLYSTKLENKKKRVKIEALLNALRNLYRHDSSIFSEHHVLRLQELAHHSQLIPASPAYLPS